jgi:hypothetical protein
MRVKNSIWKSIHIGGALLLLAAAILPSIAPQKALAYALPTDRSIQISSSENGDTGVTYKVRFTAGTTATVKSIVVDFCSNSPIISDSCTAPTGFSVGASPSVTLVGGITATWTAASANTNRTLTLTKAAGDALTSGVTDVEFDLTGVTNPSTTNTSFYARILTYPNDSGANSAATYTATSVGNATDAGGIAMSTAELINITAKVQERLVFCVYTTGAGNNCSGKSDSAVTLGDTNGVLDPTGPYVDKSAKYSITTNASGGAIVRVKGATLTSGGNSITEIGDTAASSALGTEQFGFCNYQSAGSGMTFTYTTYAGGSNCSSTTQTAGTGSTGGVGTATFGFDATDTASTYGDPIATKPAGDYSTAILAFVGNIANTTEAGIYSTTLTFIATGTY